jgi:hypothetical protein
VCGVRNDDVGIVCVAVIGSLPSLQPPAAPFQYENPAESRRKKLARWDSLMHPRISNYVPKRMSTFRSPRPSVNEGASVNGTVTTANTEYERQRQMNIAKNKELLNGLSLASRQVKDVSLNAAPD